MTTYGAEIRHCPVGLRPGHISFGASQVDTFEFGTADRHRFKGENVIDETNALIMRLFLVGIRKVFTLMCAAALGSVEGG